jgi:hypothetical protein
MTTSTQATDTHRGATLEARSGPGAAGDPSPVPDLVGQAQAELEAAEAARRALADDRRALKERLDAAARTTEALRREVQRTEKMLEDASSRAADLAALAELGFVDDSLPGERQQLDALAQRRDRLMIAAQEDKRRRTTLAIEDGLLVERERGAEALTKEAQLALERARQVQLLHDLRGVVQDTLHGPLVLVDATVDGGGACTWWVADAAPDDLHSPGRLWRVTDYGAYRRLYPDLPDAWLERRTRPQYARLTVPSDGLLSAQDTLAILERLARPCQYRLVSLHYTHRDGNGVDRYVVHTLDGTRPVALKTAGMARQILGD